MAQVAQDTQLQARSDRYLDYLFREWRRVPQIAREWETWEDHVQLDFVVEWPIREDRLHQLRQWAERGLLKPAQEARYQALVCLVAEHRLTLEQLLKD